MNSQTLVEPAVRFYLLNAPYLERDGTPVSLARRKAVALLAYLALTRQAHLRDGLAALLWPDSGQAYARANLRHTLAMLKQVLGDDVLDVRRDRVALKPTAPLWVDVLHFQKLLAACRAHHHPPDQVCADCLPLLHAAVALPVEHFLAGFTLSDCPDFDDWQRAQQQQLSQARCDALARLVHYFSAQGDYKAAIEHAQRMVELDPLDEAAHRQLMQLYARSGQHGLAARQFAQCTDLLAQELNSTPAAETVQLLREIQAGHVVSINGKTSEGQQRPAAPSAPASNNGHAANGHTANGHPLAPVQQPGQQPGPTARHNLPLHLPALIGREQDLQTLQAMAQRAESHLVTLAGPGGVGKTLLALQLAAKMLDHFADGVFFVSLAALHDAESMIAALAQTWNLQQHNNQSRLAAVQQYLRDKEMLLILDNFEHLVTAAALTSELRTHCPNLRLVVTSRERLNVQGEQVYAVTPLTVPKPEERNSVDAVAKATAVQLFVQRAQAIRPDFVLDESNAGDIADICIHLDGVPLAIELVVARIRLLSPHDLRRRLLENSASSFELLRGGGRDAPARHQTLRDTIAWSYALLNPAEQWLFRLLAVFVGGFTLEAVEQLCARTEQVHPDSVLELLESMVDKSLIQQTEQPRGESRFAMLALIREFALEQLQANGELSATTHAHAATFADFAETATAALSSTDHLTWIARLNADHANCRVALRSAIGQHATALAMRLGGALWTFWLIRANYREGRQFLAEVLQLPGADDRTAERARILTGLGAICRQQGDMHEARAYLDEAVAIYRELGDAHGHAIALEKIAEGCYLDMDLTLDNELFLEAAALYEKVGDRISATRMRHHAGQQKYHVMDYAGAQAIFEATLAAFAELRHAADMGHALHDLGRVLFQKQEYAAADARFVEALAKAQARGDQRLTAHVLYFRGRVAYYQADFARAEALFEESLHINRNLGANAIDNAFSLMHLSDIALARGETDRAQAMLREGLLPIYADRHPYAVPLFLPHCALLVAARGNPFQAAQIAAAGHALYWALKGCIPPNDQQYFDTVFDTVRPQLAPEEFRQACAAGEQMNMTEAVELALAAMDASPTQGNEVERARIRAKIDVTEPAG